MGTILGCFVDGPWCGGLRVSGPALVSGNACPVIAVECGGNSECCGLVDGIHGLDLDHLGGCIILYDAQPIDLEVSFAHITAQCHCVCNDTRQRGIGETPWRL